jgi:hypothetical protein
MSSPASTHTHELRLTESTQQMILYKMITILGSFHITLRFYDQTPNLVFPECQTGSDEPLASVTQLFSLILSCTCVSTLCTTLLSVLRYQPMKQNFPTLPELHKKLGTGSDEFFWFCSKKKGLRHIYI